MNVPLEREEVTRIALVPRLNKRGVVSAPTLRDISIKLDKMYDARLSVNTTKMASRQMVRFGLALPSPIFLGHDVDAESILERAMSFIWELVTKPHIIQGGYPQDRFRTEVEEHRRDVMGIINDRQRYASVRLMEELSGGDPSGLPSWGVLDDLSSMKSDDVWNSWVDALSSCPISIYAVGAGSDDLAKIMSGMDLSFPTVRKENIVSEKSQKTPELPRDLIDVEDFLEGEQTILCMAFYTGITHEDPLMPALMVYDGILGGFPHSKLFSNVREKESLAYSAYSSANTWRGLVQTVAGIDDGNLEKTRDLIAKQVDEMKKGIITEEEFSNTKAGLLRRLRSESDSQEANVMRDITHRIMGGPKTAEEIIESIGQVTLEDVVDISSKTELKAVYALRAKNAERG